VDPFDEEKFLLFQKHSGRIYLITDRIGARVISKLTCLATAHKKVDSAFAMPLLLALFFVALFAIGVDSFIRNSYAQLSTTKLGRNNFSKIAAPLFESKDSSKSKEKRPWEFGRFLKTAGFYGALKPKIPIVSGIVKKLRTRNIDPLAFKPADVLWNSSGGGRDKNIMWGPLDDVVMGGASKSELEPGDVFNGCWKGVLTTANSGGFTGIRTKQFSPLPYDVSACKGIALRVRGDGNRYKCIIRDDEDWNGIAWAHSFDTTPGEDITVPVPFESFKPTRFAKIVPGLKFNKKTLHGIQMSLSKFEYDGGMNPRCESGPFELNIESITLI
jgi:hypothetical protein